MVRVRQAEDMEKPLDLLLSALNIFRIITKVQDFESWLKAYHNKEVNEELAEGYKFFILSNICVLIDAIEIDYSLNLTEDFIFFRGRFKGLNIEEIPNTSEKTIFIKNVWLRTKPLRKAKNWTEIRASLENLEILNTIFELLYKKCVPKLNIEKDWALNVITKFYTLTFLNDTSEGIPKGCISPSTVRVSKASEYLNRVFEGYKLTLQYLWFKLLPEKDFSKSCLKEMHKAGNWEALDEFFGKINEEIMKPLINTLGLNLVFEPLLVISKRFDKKTLKTLLSNNRLKEPEYFKKKNIEDIKRWLDYKLLWYNVEVLSSTGSIFSGVPAFVSSLKGLTEFNKKVKIGYMLKFSNTL